MLEQFQDKNLIEFIENHRNDDLKQLMLKFHDKVNFDLNLAINQIQGIQKVSNKLPTWIAIEGIIFPANLNLQQSSSEKTAKYKSGILKYEKSIDLTGGFGVDSFYFSKNSKEHTYLEPNEDLFKLVKGNFETFNCENVCFENISAEDFLANNNQRFDLIYLDPSRRKEGKQIFMLEDYSPNVLDIQDDLFKFSTSILIKASPILDIKNTLKVLKFVKEVHIVSVDNEVKEVLYLLEENFNTEVQIICVNIKENNIDEFNFTYEGEKSLQSKYNKVQKYLYEPNASIMKAGGFNSLCDQFNIIKINPNTHLYTSNELIDFQGRVFEIHKLSSYDPKKLNKLVNGKANINVRNFPYSVKEIRKKTKIKDGGDNYLFGIKDIDDKPVVLLCKRLS